MPELPAPIRRPPFGRRHRRSRAAVTRAAVACAGAALLAVTACADPGATPVRVVIPPGSSFRAAADSLERAGVIHSSRLFRFYAKVRGQDRALKPGT